MKSVNMNFIPGKTFIGIFFTILLTISDAFPYNMRQTSNDEGLSNSAILSMALDSKGYLWVGTCDGVNIAGGNAVYPFSTIFPGKALSGNIIEDILSAGSRIWVLTNYGLDMINYDNGNVDHFSRFHGQEKLCKDDNNTLYLLTETGVLHRYDTGKNDFTELGSIPHKFNEVLRITAGGNCLRVVTTEGIFPYSIPSQGKESTRLEPIPGKVSIPVRFAKQQEDKLFFIDGDNNLMQLTDDNSITTVKNINDDISWRGEISDLIHDHQGNFFISFSTTGAIWLGMNRDKELQAVDLGLRVGIFSLEKSPYQDVIWIGTDCQGVYTFWDDQYSLRSYDFHDFGDKISHPVRSIYMDGRKNLWLGTKGDGLLQIRNFNEFNPRAGLTDSHLYTSSNSALSHNSVFSIGGSHMPILWIGTEEGLNYYDYQDNSIHSAKLPVELKLIHGVFEENDSTLWLATNGMGVAKVKFNRKDNMPVFKDVNIYTAGDGNHSSNFFFSLTYDGNGRMLFCNRGLGVFELKDEKLVQIPLKNTFGSSTVNDVFDALVIDNALWLGTGHGLIKSYEGNEELFLGPEHGFDNNTVHEMLHHENREIWISTNKGIVRFNPSNNESETYGKNYGLSVNEYSDGAGFDTGSSMIFGGTNGITIVRRHDTYVAPEPFAPDLSILTLDISGKGVTAGDYLKAGHGKDILELDFDENYFAVTFSAPDFINGKNYTYYYTLDGTDWISNGTSPTISFNHMTHGRYHLKVKYLNHATGKESRPYEVDIIVNAPWYLSLTAKIIYLILFMAFACAVILFFIRRQREKQERKDAFMEQAHKEEVYEEKLRFFTNITHEFCTPLTLIYGPCERILDYPGSDDYIRKYVGLIRTNAERLNNLIQELIDFRRMETGHKVIKVRKIGVSELCNETFGSFTELAERNNINYVNDIKPSLSWNSDYGCLKKILNNLISNAFKYTFPGGTIKVGAEETDGRLRLSVYNTGKGVSEEDKGRIFNRYTVLDNVEQNAIKGISSRNGLGMAICHSMVDMLHGTISIDSEVGKFAEFIVTLPQLTITEPDDIRADSENPPVLSETEYDGAGLPVPPRKSGSAAKPEATILVLDDNREILTLLSDSLTDYNVITAENADEGLRILKDTPPDIIISDIMMPGTDGTAFTRQIKQNRHTMHLPLILLSAKTSNEERIKGIEAGADAYIGKPFSISYLKAVVRRLLENRESLKQYYNTSASSFEFSGGKLRHIEEMDFLTKVTDFIDAHIDDHELSAEQVALHLKISTRNLYRKFKDAGETSPNDFIKNYRIKYAGRLLLSTALTVQEIIYRCGFTNRSHFYKEFAKRFGSTPKEYRAANQTKDTNL